MWGLVGTGFYVRATSLRTALKKYYSALWCNAMNRESVPVESETLGQDVSVAQVVELLVSSNLTGPLFPYSSKKKRPIQSLRYFTDY